MTSPTPDPRLPFAARLTRRTLIGVVAVLASIGAVIAVVGSQSGGASEVKGTGRSGSPLHPGLPTLPASSDGPGWYLSVPPADGGSSPVIVGPPRSPSIAATGSVPPPPAGSKPQPPLTTPTFPAEPAKPQVAFLGDSFTQAAGATSPGYGWTSLVCAHLGWVQHNFGEGGTGYTTQGPNAAADTYPQRVPYVVAIAPTIVVVSGGMNDEGKATDAEFVQAVTSTFQQLRSRLPHAVIIGVNPFWDAQTPPARLATMAQEIATAVADVGGIYLDVGDPLLHAPRYLSADRVHPNDAGHQAIAAAFIQAYAAR